jgi:hypothetical protein
LRDSSCEIHVPAVKARSLDLWSIWRGRPLEFTPSSPRSLHLARPLSITSPWSLRLDRSSSFTGTRSIYLALQQSDFSLPQFFSEWRVSLPALVIQL